MLPTGPPLRLCRTWLSCWVYLILPSVCLAVLSDANSVAIFLLCLGIKQSWYRQREAQRSNEEKELPGSLQRLSPWFKFLSRGLCETSLQAQNKFSLSLTVIPMGFECLQLPAQLHPEATEHIPVWQEPLALGTCDLCSDSSLDGRGVTPDSPHISLAFPGGL